MPRFFLHICNRDIQATDDEGRDFPDLDAARAAAIEGIRSILADEILSGTIDLRGEIRIADEYGYRLATVSYSEALQIRQ